MIARQDLIGVLQKNPEQIEFARCQGDFDAVTTQDMGVEMQTERPER